MASVNFTPDHERRQHEASVARRWAIFDHAYAEAWIENRMRDAIAQWRQPMALDAGYIEMATRIGDLLCCGVEIELRKRQQ